LASLCPRRRLRLWRGDQQDQHWPRIGALNSDWFAHQKETERRLIAERLASGHNAEGNIALGTAECALDSAFHRIALNEMHDPPVILR
jgi:hypothetical protein